MAHWSAAKRVLWYLKGTKNLGLTYKKGEPYRNRMYGYADASFATNADMTSTNGNMFILNGAAITWNSKRQQTVALSTAEVEYVIRVGVTLIQARPCLSPTNAQMTGVRTVTNYDLKWPNSFFRKQRCLRQRSTNFATSGNAQ